MEKNKLFLLLEKYDKSFKILKPQGKVIPFYEIPYTLNEISKILIEHLNDVFTFRVEHLYGNFFTVDKVKREPMTIEGFYYFLGNNYINSIQKLFFENENKVNFKNYIIKFYKSLLLHRKNICDEISNIIKYQQKFPKLIGQGSSNQSSSVKLDRNVNNMHTVSITDVKFQI